MEPGGNVTRVEGQRAGSREALYRRRHAALAGAITFERLIAEGGMGAVLLARGVPGEPGPALGRVAIKVLREDLLGDAEAAERFRRELASHLRLSRRLQAPRLVPCLKADTEGDPARLFGAFPFYEDGTLGDFMARGGDLGAGLRTLADAVEGLQGLHGHGYIHRDVCPGNIFISREGGASRGVLGDFGVAVPVEGNTIVSKEQAASELALGVGHLGYTDPCAAGTPAADLYGAGATLYWLVSGSAPPVAPAGALQLPPVEACRRGCTAELHRSANAVLRRLTVPVAAERYASAQEARVAIVALAEAPDTDQQPAAPADRSRWQRALSLAGRAAIGGTVSVVAALVVSLAVQGARVEPPAGAAAATPLPVAAVPPDTGDAVARAREALVGGAPAEGERWLRLALEQDPAQADAAVLLGMVLARADRGGLDEAAAHLERALAAHPARGDARLVLARVLAQVGRAAAALAALDEAPADTTHRDELLRARVTLARAAHRSR